MKRIILVFLSCYFLSCNNNKATRDNSMVDSLTNLNAEKIFIKDKSKYSKVFLDELSPYLEQIKLVDNLCIVGNDTIIFPDDLKINKEYIFSANKDNQLFNLTVKRINETTLNFDFNLYKNDSLIYTDKGEANLNPTFFLGSEGDDDDQGGGYESYDYTKKSKDSYFEIRIGVRKKDSDNQRAKIQFNCNDKNKMTLELDNCPILRTK